LRAVLEERYPADYFCVLLKEQLWIQF